MDVIIEDHTKEVVDETELAIRSALEQIGGLMERYAKQRCPVDTGLLRNSITYVLSGQQPNVKSYHADRGSTGKSAGSKGAGSVQIGGYSGVMGSPDEKAVYVGTNVEYAQYVEFNEKARHRQPTAGAHFIRDSLKDHLDQYKKILANELKKVNK